MNKKAAFISIAIISALCACDRGEQMTDKIQESQADVVSGESSHPQNEEAKWVEITQPDGTRKTRCLAATGCKFGDKRYPAGSELHEGAVFCGNEPSFTYVDQFYCESHTGKMRCNGMDCHCGREPMRDGQFCHEEKIYNDMDLIAFLNEDDIQNHDQESDANQEVHSDEDGDNTVDRGDNIKEEKSIEEINNSNSHSEKDDHTEIDGSCNYSDRDIEGCKARKDELLAEYGSSFTCTDVIFKPESTCGINHYYEALNWCDRTSGCRTPDGRIYPYKMHDTFKAETFGGEPLSDLCPYYLLGNRDTTRETHCLSGDCVWPNHHDIDYIRTDAVIYVRTSETEAKKLKLRQMFGDIQHGGQFTPYDYHAFPDDSLEHPRENWRDERRMFKVQYMAPDTATCAGGKKYCHGTQNAPVPAPEPSTGYECRQINSIPPEDSPFRRRRILLEPDAYHEPLPKSFPTIRDWVCMEDGGCACGGTTCPRGASCHDGKCECAGVPLGDENDYVCEPVHPNNDQYYFATCRGENCPCGGQQCIPGAKCHMDQCYIDISCINKYGNDRYANNQCYKAEKQQVPGGQGWQLKQKSMELRCKSERGCEDGQGNVCAENTVFWKGRCLCGGMSSPGDLFRCEYQMRKKEFGWVCGAKDGCGQIYGVYYKMGNVYAPPKCWAAEGLTPEGCKCGDEMYNENAICLPHPEYGHVNVCNSRVGACKYRGNRCQYGEYMAGGKCLVPDAADGRAAENYWLEKSVESLKKARLCRLEEGCVCGSETCGLWDWCQDGACQKTRLVSFRRFGKMFHYEYSDDFEAGTEMPEFFDSEQIVLRMLRGDWQGCTGSYPEKSWTLTSGEGDDISNLYCSFEHDCAQPQRGTFFVEGRGNVEPNGYSCLDRSRECACGRYVCGKDHSCSCDLVDGRLSCHCEDIDAYAIDEGTERHCEGTTVPSSSVVQYLCRSGLGFVCGQKEGCDCGNVRCTAGAVCVQPGVCTQDVVYRVE